MGLDVSVIRKKDLVCPKCGEVVSTISMGDVDSGGRVWYPFLESIGYYVPYDNGRRIGVGKNDGVQYAVVKYVVNGKEETHTYKMGRVFKR